MSWENTNLKECSPRMGYHRHCYTSPLPRRSLADTGWSRLRRLATFGLWVWILFGIGQPVLAMMLLAWGPMFVWLRGRNVVRPGRGYLLALTGLLAAGVAVGWAFAFIGVFVFAWAAARFGDRAWVSKASPT